MPYLEWRSWIPEQKGKFSFQSGICVRNGGINRTSTDSSQVPPFPLAGHALSMRVQSGFQFWRRKCTLTTQNFWELEWQFIALHKISTFRQGKQDFVSCVFWKSAFFDRYLCVATSVMGASTSDRSSQLKNLSVLFKSKYFPCHQNTKCLEKKVLNLFQQWKTQKSTCWNHVGDVNIILKRTIYDLQEGSHRQHVMKPFLLTPHLR